MGGVSNDVQDDIDEEPAEDDSGYNSESGSRTDEWRRDGDDEQDEIRENGNSGALELINSQARGQTLYQSGKAAQAQHPSLLKDQLSTIGQAVAIEIKTIEKSRDQERLIPVNNEDDGFESYALSEVINEPEDKPLKQLTACLPHYLHRDLPLSEYARQFRMLREGALSIRKEMLRSASKDAVYRMAAENMCYVGSVGLTQDTNVLGLISSTLDAPSFKPSINPESVSDIDLYSGMLAKMTKAHASAQDIDVF